MDSFYVKIIPYEKRFRDDMIFMVLEAKDALGRVPTLNEDLMDINRNYIGTGDAFFLALDERERVVGCVGFSRIENTDEAFLHRLYVKAALKRRGIGTRLLQTAEEAMKEKGITVARVHLGDPVYYSESYSFYPKNGYTACAPSYMMKKL